VLKFIILTIKLKKLTTMEHTDFDRKIEQIKQQETAELIAAVNAHGGKFQWPMEDDDDNMERPIIAINPDSKYPNPTDVEVISVCVNSGRLELIGLEKNDGYEIPFTPEEVFPGHLSFIIDYIPETEDIKDVTKQTVSFPIASVSRDDLKERGFDIDNIDDDDMSDLAERMGDAYREIVFYIDLDAITNECFEFPRIWNKWFQNADFPTMEKITGYRQSDFSPEDGYQDFVDACEDWWGELSTEEKREIYMDNV
jgi:hypothetical protein